MPQKLVVLCLGHSPIKPWRGPKWRDLPIDNCYGSGHAKEGHVDLIARLPIRTHSFLGLSIRTMDILN
jgi:hypothetical protein